MGGTGVSIVPFSGSLGGEIKKKRQNSTKYGRKLSQPDRLAPISKAGTASISAIHTQQFHAEPELLLLLLPRLLFLCCEHKNYLHKIYIFFSPQIKMGKVEKMCACKTKCFRLLPKASGYRNPLYDAFSTRWFINCHNSRHLCQCFAIFEFHAFFPIPF